MQQNDAYPALRYVDVIPISEGDQERFYFYDPQSISNSPLILSPLEFYIAALFNGRRTANDINDLLSERFPGLTVELGLIQQLADILDEHYYLYTPRFYEYEKQLKNEFESTDIRVAWHAGTSYSDDAAKLGQQLDSFYAHPEGPGELVRRNGQATDNGSRDELLGIVVPHIDLRVGAHTYTHAYQNLVSHSDADLFVILGVAHSGGNGFFICTEKDFETPLGRVATNKQFIRDWGDACGENLTASEWVHRTEHSVEFQIPFLQHAVDRPFEIVPVLCTSIEPLFGTHAIAGQKSQFDKSVNALLRTIKARDRKVCLIISVDLAHMGPKFGDSEPIDDAAQQRIKDADHAMFEAVGKLDIESYVQLMQDDLFDRRVDACAGVYAMLSMMEAGHAKMLCYDQNFQPDTKSVVSYGSMAVWGRYK